MIGHKNNKTKGTNNAPIPEDNEQYCFRMPLKLEVHKRYWTTQKGRQQNFRTLERDGMFDFFFCFFLKLYTKHLQPVVTTMGEDITL